MPPPVGYDPGPDDPPVTTEEIIQALHDERVAARREAFERAFDHNALRVLVKEHNLEVGDGPTKSDLVDALAKSDVPVPGVDDM